MRHLETDRHLPSLVSRLGGACDRFGNDYCVNYANLPCVSYKHIIHQTYYQNFEVYSLARACGTIKRIKIDLPVITRFQCTSHEKASLLRTKKDLLNQHICLL